MARDNAVGCGADYEVWRRERMYFFEISSPKKQRRFFSHSFCKNLIFGMIHFSHEKSHQNVVLTQKFDRCHAPTYC